MSGRESPVPVEVVDRLLWRDAQQLLRRHAEPGHDGACLWCGRQWPCPPRRLAERAEAASCRPWRESWTARHDLQGLKTLPGTYRRAGVPSQAGPARATGPISWPSRSEPAGVPTRTGPRRNGGHFA